MLLNIVQSIKPLTRKEFLKALEEEYGEEVVRRYRINCGSSCVNTHSMRWQEWFMSSISFVWFMSPERVDFWYGIKHRRKVKVISKEPFTYIIVQ